MAGVERFSFKTPLGYLVNISFLLFHSRYFATFLQKKKEKKAVKEKVTKKEENTWLDMVCERPLSVLRS